MNHSLSNDETMESLAGKLLIAVPELPDSNFFRSVVLIMNHTEEGAMGVVLNRPSNLTVAQVWDEISPQIDCDCNDPINVGGPVEGPLMALHTSMAISENDVLPGVYLSISHEKLDQLVLQSDHEFKMFRGYSGWAPGQLEHEIEFGGWLTLDADFDHVFETPERLWKLVCEHVGHQIMLPHFQRKSSGVDPSLN